MSSKAPNQEAAMWTGRQTTCAVAGLLLLASALSATARADGLPVLGVDAGTSGVAAADGAVRYVTVPAAGKTLVARIAQKGGHVRAYRLLPGSFTVPAVAYDGSASGLSQDGGTLALIQPRAGFPRARTPLLILDAQRLRVRQKLILQGDYSFDAISANGRWLYLIHYLSARDPNRYEVRAYNLRTRRLVAQPITDPREPDEAMLGQPLTRAGSADGRWAYTLYQAPGGRPFVHALDTQQRRARCIDLPMLTDQKGPYTLALRGRSLSVRAKSRPAAFIDLHTFQARPAVPATAVQTTASDLGHNQRAWLATAALLAAIAATAAATLLIARTRRRPRRPAAPPSRQASPS
jgi:hypothetical protein